MKRRRTKRDKEIDDESFKWGGLLIIIYLLVISLGYLAMEVYKFIIENIIISSVIFF